MRRGTPLGKAMAKSGLSQRDVADAIGVAQSTVCRWQAGTREPRQRHLRALATLLRVDVGSLIGRAI